MKYTTTTTSLALVAATMAAAALPAQLPPGHYLVGTQGWVDNKPDSRLNTVQLVDPYSTKTTMLTIAGIPSTELPSNFVITTPVTFLMGTKVAATPANGNVYRVTLTNGTWQAVQLNTSKLNLNVASMVIDGGYVYVAGSGSFGTGSNEAQTRKIARANGAVTVHARFGKDFVPGGALGAASGMVRIGKTLHIFTWNSSSTNTENQHWTVTTDNNPTVKKVGLDLPMSKRFAGRGFAAGPAVLDPASGNIVVVGRWGELLWRTPTGSNDRYEQYPGALFATGNYYYTQMWRAATLNTDTWAIALGDHQLFSKNGNAAIDERRCNGASPSNPFTDDVRETTLPTLTGTVVSTISALTYVPTFSTYHPIGDGCKASTGAVPCSYVTSPPSAGNLNFGLTLETNAKTAMLFAGRKTSFDFGRLGAPGCTAYVNPFFVVGVRPTGGMATFKVALPASAKGAFGYVQWMIRDGGANALGLVLSEARKVTVR